MTWPAILLMSSALLAVSVLAGWCYYRVLTAPERDSGEESAK